MAGGGPGAHIGHRLTVLEHLYTLAMGALAARYHQRPLAPGFACFSAVAGRIHSTIDSPTPPPVGQ